MRFFLSSCGGVVGISLSCRCRSSCCELLLVGSECDSVVVAGLSASWGLEEPERLLFFFGSAAGSLVSGSGFVSVAVVVEARLSHDCAVLLKALEVPQERTGGERSFFFVLIVWSAFADSPAEPAARLWRNIVSLVGLIYGDPRKYARAHGDAHT